MSLDMPAIEYIWQICHAAPGYLVDGGAGEGTPEYGSMSYRLLHEARWRGILVEPVAERAAELRAIYRNRPDVQIAELALGAEDALVGHKDMWVAPPRGWSGASTLSDAWALGCLAHWPNLPYVHRTVKVKTLAMLLRDAGAPQPIDFLKLDVEGYELPALRGMDWTHKPRIVAVETLEVGGVKHAAAIDRFMTAHGYALALQTGDNAIWNLR